MNNFRSLGYRKYWPLWQSPRPKKRKAFKNTKERNKIAKPKPKIQKWQQVSYNPNSYLPSVKKLASGPQNLPGKWRDAAMPTPQAELREPVNDELDSELRCALERAKSDELEGCESLLEVAELFARCSAPYVELANDAKRSAKNYKRFERYDIAWEMLCSIALELYTIKFIEHLADIERQFNRRVASFEYARSEGPMSKTVKITRERTLKHKGKSYEIWPHIKWGRHEPEMLRIHLAYDEERQKIIVGYIGPHMRNRSSLTRSH